MRLIRDIPEVEAKIKDGTLTLSNAAKIQTYIKQSTKEDKPLNITEKKQLIQKIENKSARECDLELLKISPEPVITKSKERVISEEYTELKITVKKDLKEKIEQVKSLLSHQNPNGDLNKLLELMCDMVIKKKDPSQRKASTTSKVNEKRPASTSRHIPSTIKQEVYMRDKGSCTFTDHKTKRRCCSKHLLQYDHIKPIAFNGETSVSNLRLLCFQHHRLVTEKSFGRT